MKISLIIPCYNEEDSLPPLYEALKEVTGSMPDYDFEMIFVDDGSKDRTLPILKELAEVDERITYISFSRNFGKEAAMYAGFCNVSGDYAAVMDADMQHPPSLIPEMVKILETGEYDSVAARRTTRKGESKIRSFFSRCFYKLMGKISDANMKQGATDFRLMRREMVDAIVSMSENNRFSKGIFGWVGFKTYWLPYENVERVAGKTKWSFFGLLKYSTDGIMSFSTTPLKIASWSGLFFTFCSIALLIFVFIRAALYGDPVAGWPSTICIILFIGGVQLFSLGIMGQYISKMYVEVKNRPHYIVSQTNKKDIVRK
ncbi:MAG: glycosyltransferase family 2 protein [Clostridia bacterium]|nr:glycosyltransferase family 2 protein [Clostridia bacterium]